MFLSRCIWNDYIKDEDLFDKVVFLFKICDLFYEMPTPTLDDTTYLVTWFLSNDRPDDIVPDYSEKVSKTPFSLHCVPNY